MATDPERLGFRMSGTSGFEDSVLWKTAFVNKRPESSAAEQSFFKDSYLRMRNQVQKLVSCIASDMPFMTVHDISHLDALWEMASIVIGEKIDLNPAEGFVLGASILLHDSAMTLAAYPGGHAQLKETLAWRDAYQQTIDTAAQLVDNGSEQTISEVEITRFVLRQLHASHAEKLAEQYWIDSGEQLYLIEDSDLRYFYGSTIGQIASSHWWNVQKLEQVFIQNLGSYAPRTRHEVDSLKVACLLRVADAIHLDQRRAPRFLRALIKPTGVSEDHWLFQGRMARPYLEGENLVFTSGRPFVRAEAEAWWLAFDTLAFVDKEIRDVNTLLQSRGRPQIAARRVKGVEDPESLSRTLQTRDWRPVDARMKASDVTRIVQTLGGASLYGNDPTVPLRELIQNSSDAVQARRRMERRGADWGQIHIGLVERQDGFWLTVEDNGIGMSEAIISGPLLDFGTSFWKSSMVLQELPGLSSSGMKPIGRYGIGFFSVFMIADWVRVVTKRYNQGTDSARVLEIRGGVSGRPIIWNPSIDEVPLDGGTRVELRLKKEYQEKKGVFWARTLQGAESLQTLVGQLAPSFDVTLSVTQGSVNVTSVYAGDWLNIEAADLYRRLANSSPRNGDFPAELIRPIEEADGRVVGRGMIALRSSEYSGYLTVSGLTASKVTNVVGVFTAEALTAGRNKARPNASSEALSRWATEQAELIASVSASPEKKAQAAEVVLKCGGDPAPLYILFWNQEWLTINEFLERIDGEEILMLHYGTDYTFEEDDEVLAKDFRANFEEDESVVQISSYNGGIFESNEGLFFLSGAYGKEKSKLFRWVLDMILEHWPNCSVTEDALRRIGVVGDVFIRRTVTEIRRNDHTT